MTQKTKTPEDLLTPSVPCIDISLTGDDVNGDQTMEKIKRDDDILYQWRLNRRLEEARRDVAREMRKRRGGRGRGEGGDRGREGGDRGREGGERGRGEGGDRGREGGDRGREGGERGRGNKIEQVTPIKVPRDVPPHTHCSCDIWSCDMASGRAPHHPDPTPKTPTPTPTPTRGDTKYNTCTLGPTHVPTTVSTNGGEEINDNDDSMHSMEGTASQVTSFKREPDDLDMLLSDVRIYYTHTHVHVLYSVAMSYCFILPIFV